MNNKKNKPYGFGKSEKLCSKLLIEKLYSSPHRELFFPLSIRWMPLEADDNTPFVQVLIVAPKRKLHHAVDRNRTKRLIRECYRVHKLPLIEALSSQGKHIALSFNYLHSHNPDFHKLETTMCKLIARLIETTAACDKESTN